MKLTTVYQVRAVNRTAYAQEVIEADAVSGDCYGNPGSHGGLTLMNANTEKFGLLTAAQDEVKDAEGKVVTPAKAASKILITLDLGEDAAAPAPAPAEAAAPAASETPGTGE